MADTFLSDTEAPSLGLYLVKTPSGIAYEVKRADDDEYLFCGTRSQVRLFLRGYGRAGEGVAAGSAWRRRATGSRAVPRRR